MAGQQPLAFGAESFSVLPATMPEEYLIAKLKAADAAVILKLGRHVEKVKMVLETLGIIDRALYVERASDLEEKVVPLAELDRVDVPYFSLILVTRPA